MSDSNQSSSSVVNVLPANTNTSSTNTVGTTADKSFWSTFGQSFENYIRPQIATKPLPTATISSQLTNDSTNLVEKFLPRLNDLKPTVPIQTRLKTFEELIKLSELFKLNETFINTLLDSTWDLFRIDHTPLENRRQAFEYLIQLYQKQSERFETLMLKNRLLLILILDSSNLNPSNSLFLQLFGPLLRNVQQIQPSQQLSNRSPAAILTCDDIKHRFIFFSLITKNGTNCKHLDQKLSTECLSIFLRYSNGLTNESNKQLFDLFRNIIINQFFHLLDDSLVLKLSKYILNFSYELLKQASHQHQLNKQQQIDIKSCIDLCEKLSPNLTTIESVTHLIIVLCELLDVNRQKSNDTQLNIQIFECMNTLFNGTVGHASLFSFFTRVFSVNGHFQTHRLSQLNGALMHIRQFFDDFRSSKMKNTFLVKELHLNCLVYLPAALKSCCSESQSILFENILNLTLDLVTLATHRDLFMCLLTFNSRKFLIETIDYFSTHITADNKDLIKKYAELLNLLDKKDVFNYKTGMSSDDSLAVVLQKFRDSFSEIVFKFPHINYLSDACINNCVEYYLSRKFLPSHGKHSIKGISQLIEKYFCIKNSKNCQVRKNAIDAVCRKLFDYNRIEYKTFIDDVIQQALLVCIEKSIDEDNKYYRSMDYDHAASVIMHSDLVEIKSFLINKLIEIAPLCHYEENILKILDIFKHIIVLEKISDIDLLNIQNNLIGTASLSTTPLNKSSVILSPTPMPTQSLNNNNNLEYLSRIINALIDLFERRHYNSNNCMTSSCVKIYSILINYLESYYANYYSNASNKSLLLPSTLSSMAAETLAYQQQQQHQNTQHRSSISLSNSSDMHLFSKNFNYYALIRREIFDFLLRIRSDKNNRVQLLSRKDKRKHDDSKYLVLSMGDDNTKKCSLDYSKFLDLMLECMEKEVDWSVLLKLLTDLPLVLQYEMNLIKNSEFTQNIFKLLYKREVNTIKNRPENLNRPEYICKFFPLIASLILYHPILERSSQEIILNNFAIGITSSRSRFCLETLTIAITEMHETNAKQCAEILLKLSQFSPSQTMAQPVLELLSTISDLKKLDSAIFGRKEFIAVSAIAIKYTDPLKFNPFIILLAHYVICIWFIKCKQDFRKNYASFTCKGLYQEVIFQLDRLNKSKKDSKSPSRQTSDDNAQNKQRAMTISNVPNSPINLDEINKSASISLQIKTNLTETMKVFYRELVDITLDFMSNNMYFDNTQQWGHSHSHSSQREFLVDIYSNALLTSTTSSTLRNNSLIDGSAASTLSSSNAITSGLGSKTVNSQSRSWIVGNKIIQIKTGLFSNICLEEPNSNLSRKHRLNSTNKKTASPLTPNGSQNSTGSKMTSSLAINIPNQQHSTTSKSSDPQKKAYLASTAQTGANDSFASSESSTSFLNGDRDLTEVMTRKNSIIATDSDYGKQGDEISLSAKSDQDYFEEAIEAINNETVSQPQAINSQDEDNGNLIREENSSSVNATNQRVKPVNSNVYVQRRTNLMKRRYKSGIPLSGNERSDDDHNEDIFMKQLNDANISKQSKDDSETSSDELPAETIYYTDSMHKPENFSSQASHTQRNSQRAGEVGSFHRNQSSKNFSDNQSIDSRKNDQTDNVSLQKEMCLSSCWCNNLVEVTCRYPTKVITYVALIDSNNCTNHELSLSLMELQHQQHSAFQPKEIKNFKKNETDSLVSSETSLTEQTLTQSMKANAVELRRNLSLSRISESSVSQHELSSANSNNSLDIQSKEDSLEQYQPVKTSVTNLQVQQPSNSSLAKTAVLNQAAASHTSSHLLNKSFVENDYIYQRHVLMRKASFDSSAPISSNIITAAATRIPNQDSQTRNNNNKQMSIISTTGNVSTTDGQKAFSPNNSLALHPTFIPSNNSVTNVQTRYLSSSSSALTTSIDPSQVFLHLFQQSVSNENKEQPMLIPENPASQRSMNILDYLPCYLIHKIGVVYVGKNQAHDEKAILSNANGSLRYKNFINGLGQLMRLKDLDTNRYYSGGLETDGSAGEFTLIWFDGIIQVVFHVATMMPLREDNCNAKKKHIGNDSTLIVYNESGEEYQFNMIKGEVNCVCIEIEPLVTSNTNLVRVKTTNELTQSSWINHQEQKFVSDQNLAIVTRKIALHADIASKCYRFQKDNNGNNPYGGKWYERLKQINRIRKSCKEFYAKQQPVKSATSSSTASTSSLVNSAALSSSAAASTTNSQNNNDVQFDFTEYI